MRHNHFVLDNAGVPIIVDTAAATVRPEDADVRAWMDDQRVFLSSVMGGMTELRKTIAEAITAAGATPVFFEDFGGRDDDAEAAYLGEVAGSTIYVAILGSQYGRLMKSRLSATHEEYRAAERGGLSVSAWVDSAAEYNADQAGFIDEIRLFHTTGSYRTATDLAASVVQRLQLMAAADLSPWVKLGDSVFRARKITDDGKQIAIEASLRNPLAVSDLEQLRPGAWSGRRERRLTYNGRSGLASVLSVESTATTRHAVRMRIVLEHMTGQSVPMSMSIGIGGRNYDAQEVSMLHVRRALFGEPMPRDLLRMGGRVSDPFEDMPSDLPSDELQKAVLRLLITERLIESGHASQVHRIDLSPVGPEGRLASISWIPASGRGKLDPVSVEGTLHGPQSELS